MDESHRKALSFDFDSKLKLGFHGTKVTSDAGLFGRIGKSLRRGFHAITKYRKHRECVTIISAVVLLTGAVVKKKAKADYGKDIGASNNLSLTYTPADIEQGLICYLDFDVTFEDIVYDLSGNELNGNVKGASGSDGVIGRGLSFDGYDDYVEVRNVGVTGLEYLGNLSEGTISLWFRLDSFPDAYSAYPVFYFGDDQVNSLTYSDHSSMILEIGHSVTHNRRIYFTISKDKSVYYCFNSIEDLELHRWYHFVNVVDKEDYVHGTQEAYLNGQTMLYHFNYGNMRHPYFFDEVPSKNVCWIGRGFFRYETDLSYLHGQVDELRIYDRPLSQLEVEQLYERGYLYGQNYPCYDSDINGDQQVNMKDFAIFADNWLTDNSNADINYDGFVDYLDLSILSSNWLYSCPDYE